jgi:uncharacterized protein YraI
VGHSIKLFFAVALIAALALPVALRPAPVAAVSCGPCPATTTADLNLRAGPGPDAAILLVMPAGAQVTTLSGPTDGFFSVQYEGGTIGWAHGAYLDLDEQGAIGDGFPTGTVVMVDTDGLNLRDAPGLDGDVLDVLPWGTEGTVLEPPMSGDGYRWHRADFGSAHGAGWVAGGFLGAVSADGGFALGDTVVVVDGPLNYRPDPAIGAGVLEVLSEGTAGAILGGPIYADGWTWYQLGLPGYGPDGEAPGWVAGEFLGLA